jgi:L-lactate dehydrogenase
VEETSWIAKACLDGEPIDSDNPVRLPGQSALAKKRRSLKKGVELEPGILPALEKWSAALGVAVPEPSISEK